MAESFDEERGKTIIYMKEKTERVCLCVENMSKRAHVSNNLTPLERVLIEVFTLEGETCFFP